MNLHLAIQFLGIILLIGLAEQVNAQDTIQTIHFVGLKKTKPAFLSRFIKTKAGQAPDQSQIKKDEQALRNLNLFYEVKTKLDTTKQGTILTFQLKEVLTLLPVINFGSIKENFFFQLGAADNHLAGRGITLGTYYRYYERHSFNIFTKIPYIKGTQWGISGGFFKHATIEPIYFDTIKTLYNYDYYTFDLLGRHEFKYGHFVEAGGAFLFEKYQILKPESFPNRPQNLKTSKYLLKATHKYDQISYLNEKQEGFSNRVHLEAVYTPIYKDWFWKLQNEVKYYKLLGKNGNLALRLKVGIADNSATEFPPYVLDSYLNIRGIGNRTKRGTAELILNTEYRHTLFNYKYTALQGVAFIDLGGLRTTNQSFSSLLDTREEFAGIGLRFYLRKIYHFILRFDYAFDLTNARQNGPVFGIGQYF